MEESGFEMVEEGGWGEVVNFCREVSLALADISWEGRDAFEEWRPKEDEGRREMRDRTVDGESLGRTRMEEESEGIRSELSRARGEMKESGTELARGNARDSVRKAEEAGGSTARGIFPALARLVRGIERGIYRHVVEPTSPDYFESDSFSISIEKGLVDGNHYRCSITFDDRKMKEKVEERLE